MPERSMPERQGDLLPLVITTSARRHGALRARAAAIAELCGAPLRSRIGIPRLLEEAEAVYVVTAERDRIYSREGRLSVGEGLMKLKKTDGRSHPLLRALAPLDGAPLGHMIDATFGLGQDALHVADALGCQILGIEASAPIYAISQDALLRHQRGRWKAGASKIQLIHGHAEAYLRQLDPGSTEAVFLDPMFQLPLAAAPGFGVLRQLAEARPLDAATLDAALCVASRRVVLKLPTGQRPAFSGFNRRVNGKAFDYWAIEKELPEPEIEDRGIRYEKRKMAIAWRARNARSDGAGQ